jgi:hypothetical protein
MAETMESVIANQSGNGIDAVTGEGVDWQSGISEVWNGFMKPVLLARAGLNQEATVSAFGQDGQRNEANTKPATDAAGWLPGVPNWAISAALVGLAVWWVGRK